VKTDRRDAEKYRGTIDALHYYNPATGVNVVATPAGKYITAYQLGYEQLEDLLYTGNPQ
jgi:hypothetical protein